MDGETLEFYTKLSDSIDKDDWKRALNSLILMLRKIFVFDNLAIYLVENAGSVPEAVYARSVGRGRGKEAEASWGEEIANQVVATDKIVATTPSSLPSTDRITLPYLLGLPLKLFHRDWRHRICSIWRAGIFSRTDAIGSSGNRSNSPNI